MIDLDNYEDWGDLTRPLAPIRRVPEAVLQCSVQEPEVSTTEQQRLRFARWLYQHGRIQS